MIMLKNFLVVASTFAGLLSFFSANVDASINVIVTQNDGLVELAITNARSYENRFDFSRIKLHANFYAPNGNTVQWYGFYDGRDASASDQHVWKVRFFPDEVGRWRYQLTFSGSSNHVTGAFDVPSMSHIGRVGIDADNPRYLCHGNGSPHYWYGSIWISPHHYGPSTINGHTNPDHFTDLQFTRFFDFLRDYGVNGILLKISLFPLLDDRLSWNLKWINRAEWIVRELHKRDIFVQITIFDTWSRAMNSLTHSTDGRNHLLNAWAPGQQRLKHNYIQTIIARFAGFPNVYWELGNEMEHAPNDGQSFADLAERYYIPWIRELDPFDNPIGLSEGIYRKTGVDIGFLHQPEDILSLVSTRPPTLNGHIWTQLKAFFGLSSPKIFDRPVIMNEMVRTSFGEADDPLWKDETIRNPDYRFAYRQIVWLMFALGGSGSSLATWMNVAEPFDQAVHDVYADQKLFREFIENLPISINRMRPDPDFVISGDGRHATRSLESSTYITYFFVASDVRQKRNAVTVDLPPGMFHVSWHEPKTGAVLDSFEYESESGASSIPIPSFYEDIVMLVQRSEVHNNSNL